MCNCGSGPGCKSTSSGLDGCTHTESSDAAKVENHTSDDSRLIFLIVYFGAITTMWACAKLLACRAPAPPVLSQLSPACLSGDYIAAKLGVLDLANAKRLQFFPFWLKQHDLAQLYTAMQGEHARFKLLNFMGDLAFATSTALMLQSVSLGASSRSVSIVCNRISGGDGDGGSSSSHIISQTSQTSQTSGTGSGGFTFENSGGTEVVILSSIIRLAQGVIRGQTHDCFVQANALGPYAVLGMLAHGVGFVLAVVLGVRGEDNQADIVDATLDIQRYCSADEASLADEAAPVEYTIYFQAVLYTLVASWLFLDNLKLAIKFVIGERCASRHQQAGGGGTLGSMTVGGGGMKQGLLVSGI